MIYKIISIIDLDGNERTDKFYPELKGKKCECGSFVLGNPLKATIEGTDRVLTTSSVRGLQQVDNTTIITTRNTIYVLREEVDNA